MKDVLCYIEEANQLIKTADTILRDLVSEAYVRGATWADIGGVLGVGGTAAQKRFRAPARERLLALNEQSSTAFSLWDSYVYAGPIVGDLEPGDRFLHAVAVIVSCGHSIERDIHGVADKDYEAIEGMQQAFRALCDALLLVIMPTPITRCLEEWASSASIVPGLDRESDCALYGFYFLYQALRAQKHMATMLDMLENGVPDGARLPINFLIDARNCLRVAVGVAVTRPEFHALLDAVPVSGEFDPDLRELLGQLLTDVAREEDEV